MTIIRPDVTLTLSTIQETGTLVFDPGSACLELRSDEGYDVLSVNLEVYGHLPQLGNIFVKDYSEHEGLARSLVDASLARIVRTITAGPFQTVFHELELTLEEQTA